MVVQIQPLSKTGAYNQLEHHPFAKKLRQSSKVLALSGLCLGLTTAPTGERQILSESDRSVNDIHEQGFNDALKTQVGTEFQVNTYTTNSQSLPSVAMDADGDFVVVWDSYTQDGSASGIYAQRYNSDGRAVGVEFRVNSYTSGGQYGSSVAMDADGDFAVVWTSNRQNGFYYGIYGQRYNSAGSAVGSEFRINTYRTFIQRNASVAMDADGDFVVVWDSSFQDGSAYGIYAQRYNSAGSIVGSEFQINTYTTSSQYRPRVAMDADGDFVVVWQSLNQDGSGYGIYAQRYNSDGRAVGSEFQVNTYTMNNQSISSIAMDADGDFVVAWQSSHQDDSGAGIYAQRYNRDGNAVGSEFQVNSYTTSNQTAPSVAMIAKGDFVIVWESYIQDGLREEIYGQHFSALPSAATRAPSKLLMTDIHINNITTGLQRNPAIALDAMGNFVVAFGSYDGSNAGVHAVRGAGPLPVELTGFEAHIKGTKAQFSWQTTSETSNAGFELQQATHRVEWPLTWHPIAWIDGAGTTTEARHYHYNLNDLTPGLHQFRLKQVDFDGGFEYSPVLEVKIEVPGTHMLSAVYPNPFSSSTQFELVVAREQYVQVSVYDVQGRRVRELHDGVWRENRRQVIRFEAGDLPGSVYLIQVVGEGFRESVPVTLVK